MRVKGKILQDLDTDVKSVHIIHCVRIAFGKVELQRHTL